MIWKYGINMSLTNKKILYSLWRNCYTICKRTTKHFSFRFIVIVPCIAAISFFMILTPFKCNIVILFYFKFPFKANQSRNRCISSTLWKTEVCVDKHLHSTWSVCSRIKRIFKLVYLFRDTNYYQFYFLIIFLWFCLLNLYI